MPPRLGESIYYCCCIAAITWGLASAATLAVSADTLAGRTYLLVDALFVLAPAALVWLAGLAASHFLAER
ncbi:MAG: hypothetical protein KGJ78_00665 [Alphaproteobacteria bacterium]|nr:hypothetical protein [Alphaproteobacteria bacterium]